MKSMAAITRTIGGSAVLGGLVFAVFALWALFDPAGAQMSNDADPFAAPPSTLRICLELAISLAVAVGGIWLLLRPLGDGRERRSLPNKRVTSKESQ
ncbi:hypothetical protein [Pseudomonas sp. CGJS7]|uniref:hypothetical protein n=1 Tax=Pseudomonas sp. CGJS7 TaxID=3109348 RepID=UPI00300B12D9